LGTSALKIKASQSFVSVRRNKNPTTSRHIPQDLETQNNLLISELHEPKK